MTAEVDVARMALDRISIGQTIESLDENGQSARVCKRWFAQCRDEVLRDFPWKFAQRAQALALTTQVYPGWGYVYQYPQNCAAVRAISDASGIRWVTKGWSNWPSCYQYYPPVMKQPWQPALKDDGASQVILTDVQNAYAFFTAKVTILNVWPPDAISVFGWKLASEIGGPLNASDVKVQYAAKLYEAMRSRAQAASLNESHQDPSADSPSIQARM